MMLESNFYTKAVEKQLLTSKKAIKFSLKSKNDIKIRSIKNANTKLTFLAISIQKCHGHITYWEFVSLASSWFPTQLTASRNTVFLKTLNYKVCTRPVKYKHVPG